MRIEDYIPNSQDIATFVHSSHELVALKILKEALEAKRNELRLKNETTPRYCPEDLKEDITYISGFIGGLNWVLNFPEECRKFIQKI